MRKPVAALALAGALLAAGCGGRRSSSATTAAACLVREALPADGRFALEYRHSYYRVPARERFEAAGGGFRMIAVESPSEAVLDYYAIAGAKTPGRWMALAPAQPAASTACR